MRERSSSSRRKGQIPPTGKERTSQMLFEWMSSRKYSSKIKKGSGRRVLVRNNGCLDIGFSFWSYKVPLFMFETNPFSIECERLKG